MQAECPKFRLRHNRNNGRVPDHDPVMRHGGYSPCSAIKRLDVVRALFFRPFQRRMIMSSNETKPLAAATANPGRGRLVVDAPVRMFHVLFALCFFGAFVTGESQSLMPVHVVLGYCMIGLLVFRLVYGVVGPAQARLGVLLSRMTGQSSFLRGLARGEQIGILMRQGQNLAMVILIVLLMMLAIPLLLSGYGLYHGWWGSHWMKEIHEALGNGLLLLALAHIALVLALSVVRKSNMPWTMVTGCIPGAGADIVKKPRVWLALIVLLATMVFAVWQGPQIARGSQSMRQTGQVRQNHDAATGVQRDGSDRERHTGRANDWDD